MEPSKNQILNELGISSWQLRGNILNSHSDSVVADEKVEELAKNQKRRVEFLILIDEPSKPEWWQDFVKLFSERYEIAQDAAAYEYSFCLHFSKNHSVIEQQDNMIVAPDLWSFEQSTKKQLWMLLKPILK